MSTYNHRSASLSSVPPSLLFRDNEQQDYKMRMSVYSSKMGKNDERGSGLRASTTEDESTDDSETDALVQLLALQSYHLPGNNWIQDWRQFMCNTHPVFGICCHYKEHPIKSCTRIFALIGTVTFGLAMTSLFFLLFLWNPEFDRVVASITMKDGAQYILTTGMLLVWTIGGGIHCFFNLAIWHIAACACCQRGGFCESCACCPSLGKYMSRFFVACCVVFCIITILLRVAINDQENYASFNEGNSTIDRGIDIMLDDQLDFSVENASQFMFIVTYLVEVTLALFVYYPVGGTILFSGMLACGFNIPILGGRPYEVDREEQRNSRRQRRGPSRGSSVQV